MSNHRTKVIDHDNGEWQGSCTCRWISEAGTRQEVEDFILKHHEMVQRARAALGTRTPSLKSQRDFYAQQADDPNNSREERELWRLLARGLTARLNDAQDESQLALW